MSHDESRHVATFGLSRLAQVVWHRKAGRVFASGMGRATIYRFRAEGQS